MTKLEAVKTFVTSKTARQVLLTQKHSPKILFAVGTISVVTATVLACRATLKVSDVLDDHDKNMLDVQTHPDLFEENVTRKLQVKTTLEIAKLYAPAVGVGLVGVAALTGSHFILTKRNAGLMAAYAAVDRAYKEYRQRVVTEFGADTDRKFAVGGEDVLVEEKTADGKTKSTVKTVPGKFGGSPYAVVFDEQSNLFSREPGHNQMVLALKMNWANDKLKAQGHLFLNEVLDMLKLPRTKEGAVVGWIYRRDDEPKNGDNYVSFGVFDGEPEFVEAFIDGTEKYAVLDFNVDGVIWDKI